ARRLRRRRLDAEDADRTGQALRRRRARTPEGRTADRAARRGRRARDARLTARALRARHVHLHALPRRVPADHAEPERGPPRDRPERTETRACARSERRSEGRHTEDGERVRTREAPPPP